MIEYVLKKILGTKNDREIKKIRKWVEKINALEESLDKLSNKDIVLKAQDLYFRVNQNEHIKQAIIEGEMVEELIEAFALVREASKRTMGLRQFDVQLIGGIVLYQGKIAEMKTGEGKTLVAAAPAFFTALTDIGVHIVTVNDYLAKRDATWIGPVYRFLGLGVGIINSDNISYVVDWQDPEKTMEAIEKDIRVWPKGMIGDAIDYSKIDVHAKTSYFTKAIPVERLKAYEAHITYGTNNEFGFDYLRDNLAVSKDQIVQVKGHGYAIVDEIDSILIDEARTPLIIAGPSNLDNKVVLQANEFVQTLEIEKDFTVDEKNRTAMLTEEGIEKAEKYFGIQNLYDIRHIDLVHAINKALIAHNLYKKDVHYMVKDGEILIVDEFTGRALPGRRWSEGLHQAIEAKEGVEIQEENQTLATTAFQNYFKLYKKLAGMTGTAETEALEFKEIYNLDVIVIPTNKPNIRKDLPDAIFKTKKEKWEYVAKIIEENHAKGRPILVGTVSIEDSETLSKLLEQRGIKHNVLNAKQHEKEAWVIAQAGRKGAVTIATNMAGRGTDILLGGNPEFLAREILRQKGIDEEKATEEDWKKAYEEATKITQKEKEEVIKAGGLLVIGTERHESRRVDNQLRGRAGRQGDPGETRFILSLEDDLLRIFGGDRVKKLMEFMKIPEGEPIESSIVSKSLEGAQERVELQNFQSRKRLLEYDEVINIQRSVVYDIRRSILFQDDIKEEIKDFIRDVIHTQVFTLLTEDEPELWELEPLKTFFKEWIGVDLPEKFEAKDREELEEEIFLLVMEKYAQKEQEIGEETMREIEKVFTLNIIDNLWREQLHTIDKLREGIYLRSYAQRDPLVEFKKEAFRLFEELMLNFKISAIQSIMNAQISKEELEQQEQNMFNLEIDTLNKSMAISEALENIAKEFQEKRPKFRTLKDRLEERKKKLEKRGETA